MRDERRSTDAPAAAWAALWAPELGRLGGLLKLWLLEKPGQGASADEVRHLLEQIQAAPEAIIDKVAVI